jgi:hypothetical protein
MIALLLIYLSAKCIGADIKNIDFFALGLIGIVAIWISHPAAFILPGIALVIAFEKLFRKDKTAFIRFVALGSVWAVTLGVDFFISLRNLVASHYLENYWAGAFMPLPPWTNPKWFVDTYLSLLSMSLNKTDPIFAWIWFLIIIIGIISLTSRKWTLGLILVSPFILSLIASASHAYPLRDRLLLFLVPLVYLFLAEGLRYIFSLAAGWNRNIGLITCDVLFIVAVWPAMVSAKENIFNPTRPVNNMRPAVEYIAKNWKQSDIVFLSGGGETLEYYATSYGLPINKDNAIIEIDNRLVHWDTYTKDLDRLSGKDRVWIVFSHFENTADYLQYSQYLYDHGKVNNTFQAGYTRLFLCDFNP